MIYIIENSLENLLTAVFESYKNKDKQVSIFTNTCQTSCLEETKIIKTDGEKANRVEKALRKILNYSYNHIKLAFRSGETSKNTVIFNYICETVNANDNISENFANSSVYSFYEIFRKVQKEVHHLKGFIRFSKTEEGIYYATFSPDNDVCDLLLPHFIKRYSSMPFILHDYKYNKLCAYNGKESKIVYEKIPPLKVKDEVNFLFKTYYKTVNIKSRQNIKLMKNYMPKRYHINMPEKDELL